MWIEEDADEALGWLGEGDDVTAVGKAVDGGGGALDFDALLDEQGGEFIDGGGVSAAGKDVGFGGFRFPFGDGGFVVFPEVVEQLNAVVGVVLFRYKRGKKIA